MAEPTPERRRELLRELTRVAVEAGTYGEPAPEMRPAPERPQSLKLEDVPARLVDDAVDAWHEMPRPLALDDQMRHILAAVLPAFDQVIRAEVVRWIEAQMVRCPHGHQRSVGHKALCNWCWHNGALLSALYLARGDHGSTTAYVLHRVTEQEQADA